MNTHPPLDNTSGPVMRAFEAGCLVAAVGLVVAHAVRFAFVQHLPWWAAGLAAALALPAADFLSGLIHWAGDTWGRASSRWVGPRFLVPFRYHHTHPQAMLDSPFVTTNGDSALAGCVILLAAFLIPLPDAGPVAVFVAAVGTWGLPTSQIHKWAHHPRPPRVVRWLQSAGLILPPGHHRRHHRPPYAGHYCITTGWCNPLLERLQFWRGLEWVVRRLTGLTPRAAEGETPAGM